MGKKKGAAAATQQKEAPAAAAAPPAAASPKGKKDEKAAPKKEEAAAKKEEKAAVKQEPTQAAAADAAPAAPSPKKGKKEKQKTPPAEPSAEPPAAEPPAVQAEATEGAAGGQPSPKKKKKDAKKKKETKEGKKADAEFEDILKQLSAATEQNAALSTAAKKPTKQERREKMKAFKDEAKERQEREREASRQRYEQQEQVRRLMEILKNQQQLVSPFLQQPETEKTVECKGGAAWKVAAVEMQGWRREMEDRHVVSIPPDDDPKGRAVFAVFDGHGGKQAANYAGDNLERVLKEQGEGEEPAAAEGLYGEGYDATQRQLARTFYELDNGLRLIGAAGQSGATATVVVADPEGKAIYCANAGDSRAVLCRAGQCVPLSKDHKPTDEGERARIVASGGTVSEEGRVNGNLAVSRGLGDFQYKSNEDLPVHMQAVSGVPEVWKVPLDKECEFIIVACDGIWDCLPSEQVVAKVREQLKEGASPEDLAAIVSGLFDSIISPSANMLGSDNMTLALAVLQPALRDAL